MARGTYKPLDGFDMAAIRKKVTENLENNQTKKKIPIGAIDIDNKYI